MVRCAVTSGFRAVDAVDVTLHLEPVPNCQVESLAGAAHLFNDNGGVSR